MNSITIFDNGGKTSDRFTIINKETGDVFGCSENPNEPGGIGKFCGNCVDVRIPMYGAGWRQRIPAKAVIKAEVDNYINNARLDPNWIGKEVDFANLPVTVRQYISGLDSYSRESSKPNVIYMQTSSENLSPGSGRRDVAN
ncbi:MAG TPA: hypothetical protein VK787_07485 [Puia sp.]|jgi:hypothetical protein|nr:hypothetical protein [Puia sp.]